MSLWKKFRKTRIYSLIKILFIIAICFVIGATWAVIDHKSDPTDQAMAYFEAFIAQDYEKMYGMVDVDEYSFVDKNMYISNMKKVRESISFDTYEVAEPVSKDGVYEINFSCIDTISDSNTSFIVYLDSKRTNWQIIPDYVIDISQMIVSNVTIEVPKDFKLLLNGVDMTDNADSIKSTESNVDTYIINSMVAGTYTVSAEQDYKALVETVDIVRPDSKISISGDVYTASSAYLSKLESHSQSFVDEFYAAVKNRNPERKALQKLLSSDEVKSQVGQYIAESQEIVYWKDIRTIADYTVTEMNYSSFERNIVYSGEDFVYKVTCNYVYDYKAETETSIYNSYVYMLTGSCETKLELTYKVSGEDVVLTGVTMENVNNRGEDNSLRKPEE